MALFWYPGTACSQRHIRPLEALMFQITSAANPKLKQTIALRDRRSRDETGLFLIEGYREVSR